MYREKYRELTKKIGPYGGLGYRNIVNDMVMKIYEKKLPGGRRKYIMYVDNYPQPMLFTKVDLEKMKAYLCQCVGSDYVTDSNVLFFISDKKEAAKSYAGKNTIVFDKEVSETYYENYDGTAFLDEVRAVHDVIKDRRAEDVYDDACSFFPKKEHLVFGTYIIMLLCICMMIEHGTENKIYELNGILLFNYSQKYRLLSYMFLHTGILHFAANMASMWVLGRSYEKANGLFSLLAVVLLGGMGAGWFSVVVNPVVHTVGLSGAIFAVAGAILSTAFLERNIELMKLVGKVVILNLVYSAINPFIDNWCHLGGLIAGLLIGGALYAEKMFWAFSYYGKAVKKMTERNLDIRYVPDDARE